MLIPAHLLSGKAAGGQTLAIGALGAAAVLLRCAALSRQMRHRSTIDVRVMDRPAALLILIRARHRTAVLSSSRLATSGGSVEGGSGFLPLPAATAGHTQRRPAPLNDPEDVPAGSRRGSMQRMRQVLHRGPPHPRQQRATGATLVPLEAQGRNHRKKIHLGSAPRQLQPTTGTHPAARAAPGMRRRSRRTAAGPAAEAAQKKSRSRMATAVAARVRC